VAVLSVTGTLRSCVRNEMGVLVERAFCVITAAKLAPAEEPPVATFLVLSDKRVEPSARSQRTASQES